MTKKKRVRPISLEQLRRTQSRQDDAAFKLRNKQNKLAEDLRGALHGTAKDIQERITLAKIKDLIALTKDAERAEVLADEMYNKLVSAEQASAELLK